MTPGGWITMIFSVGFVTGLFIWCTYRVLVAPVPEEHLHGLEDIDTRDTDDD
jgi:hypothetical protein